MQEDRTMAKIRHLVPFAIAVISCSGWLWAGEVTGKVAVAKPEQVIVYIETVPGNFPATHVKMDQQNKIFNPFVLPVVQGSTVEFQNNDNLAHNVLGVGGDEFNLGSFSKGMIREHTFNKAGHVALLCNIHPEMEAHVLVLQNPYFVRPNGSGDFHLANVPAGDYVIKAWYDRKVRKQSVKVPASGSVTVVF
jgi:plastocyanin